MPNGDVFRASQTPTALGGLRVLDLTGPEAHFCGRLLADLGAEVVKVEPPDGDPGRHLGPYPGDRPDPEASLPFIYFNANKKSVTLDLAGRAGRERFKHLVRTADVVLETFPPGTLEGWGIGHRTLQRVNPGLVIASITGFGLTGPYRHFKAPAIVCAAMGGVMYLCGSPDRPPLNSPGDQPYLLASAFAAYGVLLALRNRERTGRGERVEVACREVEAAQQYVIVNYSANATILQRAGSRSPVGGGMPYGIYPAQDGYCHLVVISPAQWQYFVKWVGSPEMLTDPIWENRHLRNASADVIEPMAMEFTRQYPRAKLFATGQANHLTVAPINRPDEYVEDVHAREREMFVEVDHPVAGPCKLVRSPFRLGETPGRFFRPAPTLGQHNDEVLNHKALAEATANRGASRPARVKNHALPLAGVRVLDFSQAIAGPFLTKVLAQYGAEVIKIESAAHQQRGRARPGLDARIVRQQKVTFADINFQKRSITVNMTTEEGRAIVRRLVPACDVVVENFSPRVMERWGLAFEDLRKLRPDVIMARLSGFGITGSYRDYVGLAAVAMGITGNYYLWSYPDRDEPAGPPVWFPDYLSAGFGSAAIVAALRHRDRTGQGQLIDLGQVDGVAVALGATYLDYFVNGQAPQPMGNRHRYFAPHGVYRCKGPDAWCSIAVRSDEEWQTFCKALDFPAWTRDDRFSTIERRLTHHDELDQRIEEWTRERTPHQVMYLLQAAGVPAGAVLDGEHLFHDPQLRERGYIVEVADPDIGPIEHPGAFVRLSDTPVEPGRCPAFGEANDYVFKSLLGMSPDEIQDLVRANVLV